MAYIAKIKDTSGVTGPVGSALYGTCSTAAATAAKVVECAAFDTLIVGVTIHVFFTNSNTVASPTLNVNSTGAKAIIRRGATTTAAGTSAGTDVITSWGAGTIISFTYQTYTPSGGSATGIWVMNDKMVAKTLSIGSASLGTASSITPYTFADVSCSLVTKTDGIAATLTYHNNTKLTYSSVSIPNVTGNTSVSIPNVTGNTPVTASKVSGIQNTIPTATIASGVLTFATPVAACTATDVGASKVTLGTALSASKVTLGTALSASNITAPSSGTAWSTITEWTTNTPTAVTITAKTASKATAGTAVPIPNISVSSKTVLAPDT